MNSTIRITDKHLLSYAIWLLIFGLTVFLLASSKHFLPSLILALLSFQGCIYGLVYTIKSKSIFIFCPFFQTLYASLFYISLIGLYYFSKFNFIDLFIIPTTNENLLTQITLMYYIFVSIICLPNYLIIFKKKKTTVNIPFFKKNFSEKRIKKYLIISQILLPIILFAMIFVAGFNPISALLNIMSFRDSYTHGFANYFYIVYGAMASIHIFLLLKKLIFERTKDRFYYRMGLIFSIFYMYWVITSGFRAQLLIPFMIGIYMIACNPKFKPTIKQISALVIITVCIVSFLSIYYCFRATQNSTNPIYLYKMKNKSVLYNSLERIDAFANSVQYFKHISLKYDSFLEYSEIKILPQIGSSFLMVIPRTIVKNKLNPTSQEITRIIYPNAYKNEIVMIFGGFVGLFFTGGIFFAMFDAMLFGLIIMLLQVNFRKYIKYDTFLIFYILVFIDLPVAYFSNGFIHAIITVQIVIRTLLILLISKYLSDNKIRINNIHNKVIVHENM